MDAYRILVADDEEAVRRTICRSLENDGMITEQAENGEQAIEKLFSTRFDLLLLDLIMGDTSGFDVIQTIRESDSDIPIIVLSAKENDSDKIFALTVGADDYITKPFSPYFISAKVKASLRRRKNMNNQEIFVPPFRYLSNEFRLFKHSKEISLSAKESILMRYFLTNPNRVCSKDELYENIWRNEIVDNNTIMVSISNLRKKIEDNSESPKYITTIRGLGYRFCPDENTCKNPDNKT